MSAPIGVTRTDIERVVSRFYIQVRAHPVLGPIFANAIAKTEQAWPEHEDKIARFWANAILQERAYSGNPMQTHMTVSDIRAEHFAIWLNLFEETLHKTLTPEQAMPFDRLARRIGRGLKMGIEYAQNDGPPILTTPRGP